MSHVRLEVLPWLTRYFGTEQSGRVVLEKELSDATTVSDLLEDVTSQNQELKQVLFDTQTGRLTGYVTLILNGRLLELAGGLEAELRPGDTLRLMPTLAGG